MSGTTLSPGKRTTAADYEAIADQLLADMRRLEALMSLDRIEIDRLKSETRQIRSDSLQIELDTRAALSRLKTVFFSRSLPPGGMPGINDDP